MIVRDRPVLLMRASPRPEYFEEFLRWVREVHARDTRAVPGVAAVTVARAPQGVVLVGYVFADAAAVPVALQSAEAAYARGTLEQWAGRVTEIRFEMYAPLAPLPAFASIN
jgi:quinol monooxygenase YgiN